MVPETIESGIGSVGIHKGLCHLVDMLSGGVTHEWVVGTPSSGVITLLDTFVEGTEEADAGGDVEVFHVGVLAESVLVGEFDPTTGRPSVLRMGAGGNGMFSCRRGSIE